MTPNDFRQWRQRLSLTQAQAAEALGLTARTIRLYERGQRDNGKPVTIPKVVELATIALDPAFDDSRALPAFRTIEPNPTFKDFQLQACYEYALANHTLLYRELGNAGAGHREAYSAGYRGDRCLWGRSWRGYAFYAAGRQNRRRMDPA